MSAYFVGFLVGVAVALVIKWVYELLFGKDHHRKKFKKLVTWNGINIWVLNSTYGAFGQTEVDNCLNCGLEALQKEMTTKKVRPKYNNLLLTIHTNNGTYVPSFVDLTSEAEEIEKELE